MNIVIFLLLSYPTWVFAGTKLEDYAEATINNIGLDEKSRLEINYLENQKITSQKLDNPEVSWELGRVENTGIVGNVVGASVSQSLPVNGVRGLRGDEVQEEIEQKKIVQGWGRQEFKHKIMNTFLSLWLEREKVEHSHHRLKNLSVVKNFLTNRKFSSPQAKSDAYIVQKKVEDLSFRLDNDTAEMKRLEEYLKKLTGKEQLPFEVQLKDKETILKVFQNTFKRGDSIENLKDSELRQSDLRVIQKERKWVPDVNLSLNYQKENFPGGNFGHSVAVSFAIPLWDTGKSQANEERALKRIKAAEWKRLEIEMDSQNQDIKQRFNYYLDMATRENVELHSHKDLDKIKGYFLKGLVNVQTFLDAEDLNHELHFRKIFAVTQVLKLLLEAAQLNKNEISLNKVLK